MERLAGTLPGGWWDAAGKRHRAVEVRALTGRDEEALAAAGERDVAARVTDLLDRSLVRLGDLDPLPPAGQLLVADRDYLLLLLRRLTFDDRVLAELVCPWAGCGERISLAFSVTDVPVQEEVDPAPVHALDVTGVEVVFRLPVGADQEALSPRAARDPAGALRELLRRCVVRIGADEPPPAERVDALGPRGRAAVEAEMERVAPRVERTLDTACPECGRTVVAPLDLHRFFFGELRTDREQLYRDVHRLALRYHWSEREILSLPRPKRHAYLDLLAQDGGGVGGGA